MNANIIKTQIIHDMKFDHKGHFNIQDLDDFFVPNLTFLNLQMITIIKKEGQRS